MAKMFYKTDEAAQKLGVTAEQLKELVAQNTTARVPRRGSNHVQGRSGRQDGLR